MNSFKHTVGAAIGLMLLLGSFSVFADIDSECQDPTLSKYVCPYITSEREYFNTTYPVPQPILKFDQLTIEPEKLPQYSSDNSSEQTTQPAPGLSLY